MHPKSGLVLDWPEEDRARLNKEGGLIKTWPIGYKCLCTYHCAALSGTHDIVQLRVCTASYMLVALNLMGLTETLA